MPKKKTGFDDIFAPTAPPRENNNNNAEARKRPATKLETRRAGNGDSAMLLQAAWSAHEGETLYRKGKEDKILFFCLGILVAVVFGAAMVLGMGRALIWAGFSKFIFRLFFGHFCDNQFTAESAGSAEKRILGGEIERKKTFPLSLGSQGFAPCSYGAQPIQPTGLMFSKVASSFPVEVSARCSVSGTDLS